MLQIRVEFDLSRVRYRFANAARRARHAAAVVLARTAWAMAGSETTEARQALFDRSTPARIRAQQDLVEVSLESVLAVMIKSSLAEAGASVDSLAAGPPAGSVQRFLCEWQHGKVENAPFGPCLGSHLYAAYRRWCDASGERTPRSLPRFVGTIKSLPGWRAGQPLETWESPLDRTRKSRRMVVPPDDLMATCADPVPKGGKTQAEWLTVCFFKFAQARKFE